MDGSNPLAVADAVTRKAEILRSGQGPTHDPITRYRDRLVAGSVIITAAADKMAVAVEAQIKALTRAVVDRQNASAVDIAANPTVIGDMTFNGEECRLDSI